MCEHPQTPFAYCVQDDDGHCIQFETIFLVPNTTKGA